MTTSYYKIKCFIISLAAASAFGAACLLVPSLYERISAHGNPNLLTYAAAVVIFCLLYLALNLLPFRKASKEEKPVSVPSLIFCGILMAVHFIFLGFMVSKETSILGSFAAKYVWHHMPASLVVFSIVILSYFLLSLVRRSAVSVSNAALILFYILLAVLIAYNFYTPEIFLRDAPERYHTNAYFNSVYNVYHGSGYTQYMTSIYGHYAIFYKLPWTLLGGDHVDFIFLNACVGGISFLFSFLALHFIVKNNLLRIIGSIAMSMPILAMRSGTYWQLWPHRVLFMGLTLCYLAFCVHKRHLNRITCVLGYVLSAFAILWNTESGLFCAAALAAFWIVKIMSDPEQPMIKSILLSVMHLVGIVLSFFGAYGLGAVYNLSCGEAPQSVKDFIFPLLTSSYMTDTLMEELSTFPSAYMVVLCLFLLCIAWGITHLRFFKRAAYSKDAVLRPAFAFAIAVLGLGQLSYYMNRATYHNLEICHLPAILLICLLAERGMKFVKEFKFRNLRRYRASVLYHGAYTFTALIVLMTLCTATFVEYGFNVLQREQFHNRQEAMDFAANVAANIPENTYAFGIGTSEIYSMLRWDTGCYTLDFADIGVGKRGVADHIIEDIKSKNLDAFLSGQTAMISLEKHGSEENYSWLIENYDLSQTFEFKGMEIDYYTRK